MVMLEHLIMFLVIAVVRSAKIPELLSGRSGTGIRFSRCTFGGSTALVPSLVSVMYAEASALMEDV